MPLRNCAFPLPGFTSRRPCKLFFAKAVRAHANLCLCFSQQFDAMPSLRPAARLNAFALPKSAKPAHYRSMPLLVLAKQSMPTRKIAIQCQSITSPTGLCQSKTVPVLATPERGTAYLAMPTRGSCHRSRRRWHPAHPTRIYPCRSSATGRSLCACRNSERPGCNLRVQRWQTKS